MAAIAYAAFAIIRQATAPKVVDVVSMAEAPADQILAVVGRVRPQNVVRVQPENAGALVALLHDEGDVVSKGTLLARVRADQQIAAVAVSEAQIRALNAQLTLAKKKRARIAKLASAGWVTRAAMEEADATVEAAQATRDAVRATANQGKARTNEFNVYAPMTGTILIRPVDQGQVVGLTTVLFEMGSIGSVEIEAEVDEYFADRVPIASAVTLSPSGTDAGLTGRIREISPRVDATTGGRLMRFVSDVTAADLRPGRSVDVSILVNKRERALSLPRSALFKTQGDAQVFVVTAGKVAAQRVTIVDWPGASVIIQSGLKPGDKVILDPSSVKIGDRVDAREVPTASGRR